MTLVSFSLCSLCKCFVRLYVFECVLWESPWTFLWPIRLLICSASISSDRVPRLCGIFCFYLAWYLFATWHDSVSMKASASCQMCESWHLLNMNYDGCVFGFNLPDLCIFHVFSCILAINPCAAPMLQPRWSYHSLVFPFVCSLADLVCALCVKQLFLELVCLCAPVCWCLLLPFP